MSSAGRFSVLSILLLFRIQVGSLSAQIIIQNPSIPKEENLIYAEKIGNDLRTLSQSLSLRTDDGASWYEFRSSSPESDVYLRLDENTLFPSYSEVVTRGNDTVIRRTTEILQTSAHPKAGELVIGDFDSLPIVLRGLPWGTFSSAQIIPLGSAGRGPSFSLQLTVAGKESVAINGRTYECWKAQLGVSGFLGALMGKSSFWFTVDYPHYLVRSEGPSSGPGSPQRVLELQSYSAN